MEALLLMLNSIVVVFMVFQGLRDDRRSPGTPATSFFRMRDPVKAQKAATPKPEMQNDFPGGQLL